ncbi:MAG TPA: amino acid permease [Phycicoccus elongatus]|uniref:APC family permease n=1 Tax=Phycicoccus TaxID=367298 RepID=UPI002C24CBC9|nr:amino acid permease [Phycicoccus elongatus]MCB9405226.1 amino acid permease [Tetrasphaera sp.]HPF77382.1 amino acid permease [Phycicoccus elongatus]HPK13116.1 amino acid permease [Phycicoccus elongatus]HPQ72757.1 amino acid permease [Phycicoccus elongatus]
MPTMSLGDQLKRRKPIVFQHKHHQGEELARNLSTFQLMMFGVGATVGTGVFFVLGEAVPKAGPAVLVSFLIAGLAAGLSALCYAELASAIPVSGSTYSYAYHAMGELVAVVIAGCVLLEYGVATGAVAVGWSGYFNELLSETIGWRLPQALSISPIPGTDGEPTGGLINLPAVVLVLLCMVLLIRGASESARVNAIMVLIKLGVLILFAVIGFTAFDADHFSNFFGKGLAGVSAAAGTIFFSFIGLDAVATAGEEVKNPQKALPRAIIGALAIVSGIYLAVAAAGLAAKPVSFFEDSDNAEAGLALILKEITGNEFWSTILSAGAVISIFSVTLVTLYGQTRILFAIGRDGLIPRKFLEVSPKTMTPTFNTIVVAIVVALIGGFVPSDYLWDTVSIGTLVAFSMVAIGIIVMRRTHPDLERPFRIPGYPVTPILTVLACLYILWGLAAITWVIFGIWIAIVLLFYFFYGRHHATLNTYTDPEEIAEPAGRRLREDEE